MPSIKRWYAVSHGLNRDPEFRELRRRFGDWVGFVWHEMLAVSDTNDGMIKGTRSALADTYATLRLGLRKHKEIDTLLLAFDYMQACGWIEIREESVRIVNYAKYHRSREQTSSGKETDALPTGKYDVASERPRLPNERTNILSPKVLSPFSEEKEGGKSQVGNGEEERWNPRVSQMLHDLTQKMGATKTTPFGELDPEARRALLKQQAATLVTAEQAKKEKPDGTLD